VQGSAVLGWIVRILLLAAAVVTSWFLATNAENFAVVQMVVALALIALALGVLVLWRRR
jgi:hypothetical protein